MKRLGSALVLALLGSSACAPAHISEYQPKKRAYEAPAKTPNDQRPPTSGSLWRDSELADEVVIWRAVSLLGDWQVELLHVLADDDGGLRVDRQRNGLHVGVVEVHAERLLGEDNLDVGLLVDGRDDSSMRRRVRVIARCVAVGGGRRGLRRFVLAGRVGRAFMRERGRCGEEE